MLFIIYFMLTTAALLSFSSVFFLFASFLAPIFFYEKGFFPCSFMICFSWRFILLEIINYWRNPFIVGIDKEKLFNWIKVYSKCWSNWIQFWMEYWIEEILNEILLKVLRYGNIVIVKWCLVENCDSIEKIFWD